MLPETLPPARRPAHDRADRCPGVTRPWIADDGALVRLRLVGGRLPTTALTTLVGLSGEHGDGDLHLTTRANVQLRALPTELPVAFVDGIRSAGLLPSAAHELVRNIMVSPLSGRLGGRVDLRPVAAELDRLLLEDPVCADLAGRFLFVLDDGRGDLLGRTSDLAVVALDASTVQLRAAADQWGAVVPVADAPRELHDLARAFLEARGAGGSDVWHVDELPEPLVSTRPRPVLPAQPPVPEFGRHRQDDGRDAEHVDVPGGLLTPTQAADVLERAGDEVVVTPWRSLLLPDLPREEP